MKKITFLLLAAATVLFSMVSCEKEAISSLESSTAPNIELAQKNYEEQMAKGATSMGMHLNQDVESRKRVFNKKGIGCWPTDLEDFLALRRTEKDISFATFSLQDKHTLEVSVLIADEVSTERLQSGKHRKALFIENDLILPNGVLETFGLRKGAYFPKGDYAIEQSKSVPIGKIQVEIQYR